MSTNVGTFDLASALPKRYLLTFVYGTLRPGEGNYWIEPAVVQFWEPCTTPGVMYASGIPFCDFTDHSGIITGSLLLMDKRSTLTERMNRMELGAGYRAMDVPVTIPSQGDMVISAVAWHYPRVAKGGGRFATKVESGNFRDTPGSHYFQGDLEDEEDFESAGNYGGDSSRTRWWEDVLG